MDHLTQPQFYSTLNALNDYLEHADTEEKRQILKRQWNDGQKTSTIICICGMQRHVMLAYRCLYCGIYFCTNCAEKHFGQTQRQWLANKEKENRTCR